MSESYPDALARVKRLADAPANAPILHPDAAAAVACVLARITALEAAAGEVMRHFILWPAVVPSGAGIAPAEAALIRLREVLEEQNG